MDLKSETCQLDGMIVTINEFDGWRALQLMPRISTLLITLAPGPNGHDPAAVMGKLCQVLIEDKQLVLDLLAYTSVRKGDATFDIMDEKHFNMAFSGRLWDLLPVLKTVIEVSFADFLLKTLGELGGLIGQGESTKENTSPSP